MVKSLEEICPISEICKAECSMWEKVRYEGCPTYLYLKDRDYIKEYLKNIRG